VSDCEELVEGVWLWRISRAITGGDGVGFMELVFLKELAKRGLS